MKGYDFHRQKPLLEYIADFFCHELMLVIEVDGSSHELERVKKNDAAKEARLEEFGITVLRISDVDVFTNIDSVLKQIEDFIDVFEGK